MTIEVPRNGRLATPALECPPRNEMSGIVPLNVGGIRNMMHMSTYELASLTVSDHFW